MRAGGRVEEEAEKLRGAPISQVAALREAATPIQGALDLVHAMAVAGFGLESPPVGDVARADLAAFDAARRLLEELSSFESADGAFSAEDVLASLERTTVRAAGRRARARGGARSAAGPDAAVRCRVLLGLEEGSLPRRGRVSPFLDDERRAALGGRLERADPVSRDRYLFYTACTVPGGGWYLVREAATDDGQPREPSPFWEEVTRSSPAEDVARWTRRRSLSLPVVAGRRRTDRA